MLLKHFQTISQFQWEPMDWADVRAKAQLVQPGGVFVLWSIWSQMGLIFFCLGSIFLVCTFSRRSRFQFCCFAWYSSWCADLNDEPSLTMLNVSCFFGADLLAFHVTCLHHIFRLSTVFASTGMMLTKFMWRPLPGKETVC